jgi:ATP-dependent DNA helicase RecQ
LDERFSKPSRIHIGSDRKNLYEFQVANEKYDPLIQALLRLYGAEPFSAYVLISETALAITLKISAEQVKALLAELGKLQMLHYDPASNHPRLTWLTERIDAAHLPLDLKRLEFRKNMILEKLRGIVEYVKMDTGCRQQIILNYFNEAGAEPCGKCDLCLSRQKTDNQQSWKQIREQILRICSDKGIALDALEAHIAEEGRRLFPSVIRDLLEENILAYDEHWLIFKVTQNTSEK